MSCGPYVARKEDVLPSIVLVSGSIHCGHHIPAIRSQEKQYFMNELPTRILCYISKFLINIEFGTLLLLIRPGKDDEWRSG